MRTVIQIGTRATVQVPHKMDEGERVLALPTIIEEMTDDGVLIQMPMYQGYYYPMPRESVTMRFIQEQIPYSLQVEYAGPVKRDGFVLAKMKALSPVERHQLREHFRLNCHIPLKFRLITEENNEAPDAVLKGNATDLSEGGMRIATDAEVKIGDVLALTFSLSGKEEMLDGVTLRVEKADQGKYAFKVGVKFVGLSAAQSDRIYKYIIQEQRAQRKKGLNDR